MNTLLVNFATGRLGRHVLHHRLDTLNIEAARLIASTRRPKALKDLAARGVTVRQAGLLEPASLSSSFSGVQRALLIGTDPIDRPRRRQERHQRAIAAADHAGNEQALRECSIPGWTVLRNPGLPTGSRHTTMPCAGTEQPS